MTDDALRVRVLDAVNAFRNRIAAVLGLGQELRETDLGTRQRSTLDALLDEARRTQREIDELLEVAGGTPQPVPHVPTEAPPHRPAHVLVVEDDPANRGILTRVLHRLGYQVTPVADGVEAFEALTMGGIDCIVSDYQMPHLGGQSLYEQVEDRLPYYASRFIFVTGDYTREATRSFLDQTGRPVLGKPYEINELAAAVARVLAEHPSA